MTYPPRVATVSRDAVTESEHRGDVVVAMRDGQIVVLAGDAAHIVYPRSALKAFQATAALEILSRAGATPDDEQLAVGCSSHAGGDDHQIEAAGLLAEAGLDESALRCPADWPIDETVRAELRRPTTLSHNCSGKHALLLWAQVTVGAPPGHYLDVDAPVQSRSREVIADAAAEEPAGPGVDGCGAPAYRLSVAGLARAYAWLAVAEGHAARVRSAMRRHPHLVGGPTLPDTRLMQADARVLAKRGAEGIMAGTFRHPRHGPLGIAVKIRDGGDRAAGPVMAAVLEALGAVVHPDVRRTPVVARDEIHGEIAATPRLSAAATDAFGLG